MSNINPQLQQVIDDFADSSLPDGRNSVEYRNLIAAITTSPILNERMNTAAEKGYLDRLAVNRNPNAGASYNGVQMIFSDGL